MVTYYADWEFYNDEFLMGDRPMIPEKSFPRWATRASEAMRKRTRWRIPPPDKIPAVLPEMYALIDIDGNWLFDSDARGIVVGPQLSGNQPMATDVHRAIKLCCCELAESFFSWNQSGVDNAVVVARQGVNVKRVGERTPQQVEEAIYRRYLLEFRLLFDGV